jgi:hypothetical protein
MKPRAAKALDTARPAAGYDEALAERVRRVLVSRSDVVEKKMFGGLCFMVGGHMCCGIVRDELMLRVGSEAWEPTMALRHARVMDFTGKPMRGMVYVEPAGVRTPAAIERWVARGLAFVNTLPKR